MSTATAPLENEAPATPYHVRTQVKRSTQRALEKEQARRLIDESRRVSLMDIAGEWLDEIAATKPQ